MTDAPTADPAAALDQAAYYHQRCEAWAAWCATRRYWGRPGGIVGVLGRLTARGVAAPGGGADAVCSAELSALHTAIICQPQALDRQVFELHYLLRVRNIKASAMALGISRQHWYRLVADFRARVCAAAGEIERDRRAEAPTPGSGST